MSAGAYGRRVATRTFVVTVSESPSRVVVQDVRNARRAVAADLAALGEQIASWLEPAPVEPKRPLTAGVPAQEAGR